MKNTRLLPGVVICLVIALQNASAATSPTNVYQKAMELNDQLIAIAAEMGISTMSLAPIEVESVSPREVYFQAGTLHEKTARLMFEFTGKEGNLIEIQKWDATPSDVLTLMNQVEKHLGKISSKLNIVLQNKQKARIQNAQPKDVFQLIVQLNRLTNQLLDFKFSPAQSHQKITESIALASAVLQTYPDSTPVFYPRERIGGKTPSDVYQKLAAMYRELSALFRTFDKDCLILDESEISRENVLPSDVYDLAVLFVSQFSYWHSMLHDAPTPKQSYYPGKVLPSDVFQRLSILDQQISELMRVNKFKAAGN